VSNNKHFTSLFFDLIQKVVYVFKISCTTY
jgi:hypothetical protein